MHLQIEDYAGMNKSMLWEKDFYNYSKFSKIVENIDGMQYFYFFYKFWGHVKCFENNITKCLVLL